MATPSIEVRYEDMSVETNASVGDKQIPTVMRALKGMVTVGAAAALHAQDVNAKRTPSPSVPVCACTAAGEAVGGPSCAPLLLAKAILRLRPALQGLVGARKQRPLRIIEGASGVLRPGRFTLVLAPPGR